MYKKVSLIFPLVLSFLIIVSGCNAIKNIELNVQTPEPQHLSIVFTAGLDENEEPIGENFEFDDGEEFLIFFESNLPFGQDTFRITINEIDDNFVYELYDQGELDIDPEWNTGYVAYRLPVGHFEIEVYFHDALSESREIIINE